MEIERIFSKDQKKVFTLEGARQMLPLIYSITETCSKKTKKMITRLEAAKGRNLPLASKIEEEITHEFNLWQSKMLRLGLIPKGMWLVDFDNGNSYFCWKFPEKDIQFWHSYQDGFSGRVEIQ